jgi:hypothetical protein
MTVRFRIAHPDLKTIAYKIKNYGGGLLQAGQEAELAQGVEGKAKGLVLRTTAKPYGIFSDHPFAMEIHVRIPRDDRREALLRELPEWGKRGMYLPFREALARALQDAVAE